MKSVTRDNEPGMNEGTGKTSKTGFIEPLIADPKPRRSKTQRVKTKKPRKAKGWALQHKRNGDRKESSIAKKPFANTVRHTAIKFTSASEDDMRCSQGADEITPIGMSSNADSTENEIGREEESPISDFEKEGGEQGPGVDAEGGGNEQSHGVMVDDSEEDFAGDAEGSGGRPKKRRGVPKAKRWTHKKVKCPSKIRPPNKQRGASIAWKLTEKQLRDSIKTKARFDKRVYKPMVF